ncbi:diacylglycerol kinase family protein [Streptococcus loxodontisalivarius]|uniref:Undecaprenol kinase n=1 Tax=Streptococcus loxodontisalivarius TaxID=1349415 RepID=A0ABS2PRY3_9STRE|nr:diacylglycerol kinase family protein [Streptococcus loxodontisalivarius]MBM7642315.1 undecaprenol kinase [Streptococcus loxodontisalivarius]
MDSQENKVKIYEKSGKIEPKDAKKKWKNANFLNSFEFAWTGIKTAFIEERNMRKHAVSALLVILAGLVFGVSAMEWMLLLMCAFLVITFEIVNSAIENVVDLASDYHFSMRAKKAKDMAAGAVLMVSFLAIIIGLIIFVPKLWALLF